MGTHTPGPWKWDESYGAIVAGEGPNMLVTPIWKSSPAWGYSENIANARLIAAAPDLLAACKAAIEWHNRPGVGEVQRRMVIDALNRAVFLAEGGEDDPGRSHDSDCAMRFVSSAECTCSKSH